MKNEECQSNVLICEMGMMVLTIMKVVVTLNKRMRLKCTTAMNSELAFNISYQCFHMVIITFFFLRDLERAY